MQSQWQQLSKNLLNAGVEMVEAAAIPLSVPIFDQRLPLGNTQL
jgi:hypothetical protein